MSTILFTYEFGSGLGHVNRLVAVARRLEAEGDHRLVFALPDMRLGAGPVAKVFADRAETRQGIAWPGPGDIDAARRVATHTFADVLRLFGYTDPVRLLAAAREWRTLVEEVRPDLIVADFAPTLRLALGNAVPTVVVGNGYTVPPAGRPLPPLRPWEDVVPPTSRAAEGDLLAAVNRVRSGLSGPGIDHVADLFQGTKGVDPRRLEPEPTFVCTFSEFDPYGRHRAGPVTSPFNIPAISAGPAATVRKGPAVFVYLTADHPALGSVLSVLNGLDLPVRLYVSGIGPGALASRCQPHVGILTKPADFARLLPRTRLLIHHAGLGTAYAGLAAGTPQLVLPLNLEHLITARGLAQAGTATVIAGGAADEAGIGNAIAAMLSDHALSAKALEQAVRVARMRDADPLAGVVAACLSCLPKVVGRNASVTN